MPSKAQRPVQGKRRQTASKVRAAALTLFARYGYAAVSMRQIASEVGVQPGALYNHFPTKQDILKDLMLSHMGELLTAWTSAKPHPQTDPLVAFARFHIRYHMERADEVFVSYMELRNLEADNFAAVDAERRRYEAILTGILEDGAANGRYALDDPKVTTRALIAMLTGIATWYRASGTLSRQTVEDYYINLVCRAVSLEPGKTQRENG
ncbi:TetR family transcriptional regulator [Roseibium aquae]|uniref:TetR family transcriptional regulator n=1 Tax=Roseibium aquae TaxID=1323746 RepID=A0A916X228_9HYPH|nr:TetR/AcrR family transcriptional regulator [Roseibium aquae]GGB61655.1 TetR family transcriptional regulator [Roseibium aquae]